ncbi:MAG: phosphoribosylformylglycinamidine cyclo-ligase [Clostridiales Family XIII bacterium]|jgi:phosphoribosylformylglycinamidine cyclo-ligase|nr:phosphoribosylformylglycinamidine cyclo-ligase [Clostridiales Family XIII bacterium]
MTDNNSGGSPVDKTVESGGSPVDKTVESGGSPVDKTAAGGERLVDKTAGRGECLVDKTADGGERLTYKSAGVDTKEGERAVSLMKEHVKKTFNPSVLTGLGGFGSLYKLELAGMKEPVLVAGTDGVGTKLKLAFMMDRHDTVGQDCVAMCVNDVLCQGASPLFFLDYIATGKVRAERIAEIVKGIADGCLIAGCALVGGETAEMPDFYSEGEYDMAGFAVGIADRESIIDGSSINAGDVLLGLPSSGVHSNGFSLVRKLFFDKLGMSAGDYVEELGMTLGDALLTPTKIYASACRAVLPHVRVKGMVHVTGGGFFENIPRIMPEGLGVRIEKDTWEAPPIFNFIQRSGNIYETEMFSAFNMGIGLIMAVAPEDGAAAVELLRGAGENAAIIGKVVEGRGVELC